MVDSGQNPACEWVGIRQALTEFVFARKRTQGSWHIKPLHWYVASRLVIEGGFNPEDITPRPPFRVEVVKGGKDRKHRLGHDPALGGRGERTILGGLKTKDVDVVVSKEGIGPCVAISMKGTLNAFRNLTNRMEEAVADKKGRVRAADIAIRRTGGVADSILRYGDALSGLAGRKGMRNDLTRYEAIALILAEPGPKKLGEIVGSYPASDSPLWFGTFFERIYRAYDQRLVYGAPALERVTRRLEWDPDSPLFSDPRVSEFNPRLRA